jgi:gliding motility-associated-like protein
MKRIIHFIALSVTVLLFNNAAKAQITIKEDYRECGATTTTLRADLLGLDTASTGISLDDDYSFVVPIGFSFDYYGVPRTRLVIGDNGLLNFDTTLALATCPYMITAALAGNPSVYNCICGPWCDVNVGTAGSGIITYATVGTAPNRRFVATWCRTNMYFCTANYLTTQIILSETSNLIEVHIGHHDTCSWNGGYAIVGVQNATGSLSTAAPGRDYPSRWVVDREAWRFTPSAGSYVVSSIPYAPLPFRVSAIRWYDAATNAYMGTGPVLPITITGTKSYYASALGCSDSSTTTYTVMATHPLTPAFSTLTPGACINTPIDFTNTSVGTKMTYSWAFGDGTTSTVTNPTHSYITPGKYSVVLTVTDTFQCARSVSEDVYAIQLSARTSFKDTILCLQGSMELSAKVDVQPEGATGTMLYQWAPSYALTNDTALVTRFSGVGFYILDFNATLMPYGCTATDRLTIDSKAPLKLTNVTADQIVALGTKVQLDAKGGDMYVWEPNDGTLSDPNINNPIATPVDSFTKYRVISMTKYGCRDTAYVEIRTVQDTIARVPTAFTPNGDGRNDVFRPVNLRFQKLVDFRVFNRWGTEVFQSSDFTRGWDGTFKGEPADMGVYFYNIIVAMPDGTQKTLSGDFTLIR